MKTNERSVRGIPDIIGVCNGMFVALELKGTVRAADPLQARILTYIKSAGGLAYLVHSENWSSVFEEIKDYCYDWRHENGIK